MDSFLFCLILVAMISVGGREQLMIATLSDALADRSGPLEKRPLPLLVLAIVCTCLSAGAMAYAAFAFAGLLPSRAAWMLVAFALAIAAFELARPVRETTVLEPTRSVGAIALVLLWRQLGDGPRFVIFAFAVQADHPLTAFAGGAVGGIAAVAGGWLLGAARISNLPLRWMRLALCVGLIVAALLIGLNARYGLD